MDMHHMVVVRTTSLYLGHEDIGWEVDQHVVQTPSDCSQGIYALQDLGAPHPIGPPDHPRWHPPEGVGPDGDPI